MASGDTLFVLKPNGITQLASGEAELNVIAAADGLRACLDFIGNGGSADESAIWEKVWPSNYDGGGVTLTYHYSTDGVANTDVQFENRFEKTVDGSDQDAGGADFGSNTDLTDTPPGAANELQIASVNISHANCGSPSPGNSMRFKCTRDHDHSANADIAQVQKIVITEQ